MKISLAVLIAMVLATSAAFARSSDGIPSGAGPGGVPYGAGTQRGMQGVNNSGQTGFVTFFDRGARTAVVVAIEGSHRFYQRVSIVRGNSCSTIGSTVAAHLNNLHDGMSRGYVQMPLARIMSGNYMAVVYSGPLIFAHPVACAELTS